MSKTRFADLHLHTYYSDGIFSPEELMHKALSAGISCISITDHDTVEALPLAFENKPEGLELIAGVELSSDWQDREVHILGYFIDYQNRQLLEALEKMGKQRVERIKIMVDKLRAMNLDILADDVFKLSKFGTVGRLHLARALLEKKIISNIREAFLKFIGEDCPAYVSRFRMSAKDAISTILACGGVPVLAHPYTVGDVDFFLEQLLAYGLKGIEVYYPAHSQKQIQHYKILAQRLGFEISGGSDFHGGNLKENIKIGSVRIPYEIVDRLKSLKNELSP